MGVHYFNCVGFDWGGNLLRTATPNESRAAYLHQLLPVHTDNEFVSRLDKPNVKLLGAFVKGKSD